MHAAKLPLARFRQVEIGEETPDADGESRDQRMLNFAEPAHESGEEGTRHAIGQQEVEIFLIEDTGGGRTTGGRVFHGAVTGFG